MNELVFVLGKPFQPSLMFVNEAEAYLSETVLLKRIPLALPTNIRLGWKALPGTNTLAYYIHSVITDVKSFIRLRPGCTPGCRNTGRGSTGTR